VGQHHGSLVAVDLGASSGRVIAGRLRGGRLLTDELGRFPNRPVAVPSAGGARLHWDVLSLWAGVTDGLRSAGDRPGGVASIGIDTWAVDYGLLDGDGALLGNPAHYRDPRTRGCPARFAEHLPPEDHYAVTGTQVQPFNTVYQLAAGAAEPQQRAAARLLLVPDLLGHWLTGEHVAEQTNASTTGLLDARTGDWSPVVLAALRDLTGQDVARLLGPVVAPGTVVGEVLPVAGADAGVTGSPVVSVGSHDTASAVAAVPMSGAAAYISSGTWSLVGVELERPVLTQESRAANFTNERGVGGTVRYLRNVAGLWLLQESLRTWAARGGPGPGDLAALLAGAAEQPALRTVVDVDDAAFVAPGDMPARIAEAARRTGQPVPDAPAAVVRCVLDSLALAYRRAVRSAVALSGHQVEVVHVVGGGARNDLLCRLTADATGLPVVAGPVEATAIGNLLTQALALGELTGGLPALREVVRASAELVTHHPRGPEALWARAHERLWP
jgi:rhamnulokinase